MRCDARTEETISLELVVSSIQYKPRTNHTGLPVQITHQPHQMLTNGCCNDNMPDEQHQPKRVNHTPQTLVTNGKQDTNFEKLET